MVNSTAGFKWYAHPESDCVLLESCHPGPECDELGDAEFPPNIADFERVYRATCEQPPPVYLMDSAARELERFYNGIEQKAGVF